MNTELSASHGVVKGYQAKLAADLKGLVADADDLLKEVTHSTLDGITEARSRFDASLSALRAKLEDARSAISEKTERATDASREYVRENPWKVLGVTALAGFLLGYLISRR